MTASSLPVSNFEAASESSWQSAWSTWITESLRQLLAILNGDDFLFLGFLIALLCFVGNKMVEPGSSTFRLSQRLAVAAFIAYGIYGCIVAGPTTAEQSFAISFRALFAAGLALGLSRVLLPAVAFLYHYTTGLVVRQLCSWHRAIKENIARRKNDRELAERRRREDEEYERSAPERERAQKLAAERAKAEAEANRRRKDCRVACEILYSLHAPEMGRRFTKEMFDDFVKRHLSDVHAPEYVEERARQLQDIIRKHLEKIEPPTKKLSIQGLAEWYDSVRQQILASSADDRAKRVQVVQLNERYLELMNQLMEELKP